MSLSLTSLIHSEPCCARITPTRTSGWRHGFDFCVDALRSAVQRLRAHERLPEFDAATLRDLGLSHAPASWTPHERASGPWR